MSDWFSVSSEVLWKEKISSEDALIEFLSSSLIKGSGEVTAKKIVKFLGMDAIDKIKNDEFALRGNS